MKKEHVDAADAMDKDEDLPLLEEKRIAVEEAEQVEVDTMKKPDAFGSDDTVNTTDISLSSVDVKKAEVEKPNTSENDEDTEEKDLNSGGARKQPLPNLSTKLIDMIRAHNYGKLLLYSSPKQQSQVENEHNYSATHTCSSLLLLHWLCPKN